MKNSILKAITAGAAFLFVSCLPMMDSDVDWITATIVVMICTVWLILFSIANGVHKYGTGKSI